MKAKIGQIVDRVIDGRAINVNRIEKDHARVSTVRFQKVNRATGRTVMTAGLRADGSDPPSANASPARTCGVASMAKIGIDRLRGRYLRFR